jgi:hypothetical protein
MNVRSRHGHARGSFRGVLGRRRTEAPRHERTISPGKRGRRTASLGDDPAMRNCPGDAVKSCPGVSCDVVLGLETKGAPAHQVTTPQPQRLNAASVEGVWKAPAHRPQSQENSSPHRSSGNGARAAEGSGSSRKNQLTIIPFLRTWPARVGFDDVAVDTYDSAVNAISNESRL